MLSFKFSLTAKTTQCILFCSLFFVDSLANQNRIFPSSATLKQNNQKLLTFLKEIVFSLFRWSVENQRANVKNSMFRSFLQNCYRKNRPIIFTGKKSLSKNFLRLYILQEMIITTSTTGFVVDKILSPNNCS